jgi:hypothetical protein
MAGLAVGALAVVAFNNRKSIKDSVQSGVDKTKEVANDIKETAKATAECIKEKKITAKTVAIEDKKE